MAHSQPSQSPHCMIEFIFMKARSESKDERTYLSSNGDFDIHTGFDGDLSDLLDDSGRGLQVDDSLVDSHFVSIPGLRTFTIGGLSGGDLQDLGGHTDGTLLDQVVLDSVADDVSANVFQLLHLGGGQGDSDLVGQLFLFLILLFLSDGSGHGDVSLVT